MGGNLILALVISLALLAASSKGLIKIMVGAWSGLWSVYGRFMAGVWSSLTADETDNVLH